MGLQYAVICRFAPCFCGTEGCLCNLCAKYKQRFMSLKVCVWSMTCSPIINTSTNSTIHLHRYSLYLFFFVASASTFFAITLVACASVTLFLFFGQVHSPFFIAKDSFIALPFTWSAHLESIISSQAAM